MPELDLYEQKVLLKYMYNTPRAFSEMYGSIKNLIEKISDKECDKLIEFTQEKTWNTENIREIKECISVDRNLHIGDKISVNEFEEIYEIYGKSGFL